MQASESTLLICVPLELSNRACMGTDQQACLHLASRFCEHMQKQLLLAFSLLQWMFQYCCFCFLQDLSLHLLMPARTQQASAPAFWPACFPALKICAVTP